MSNEINVDFSSDGDGCCWFFINPCNFYCIWLGRKVWYFCCGVGINRYNSWDSFLALCWMGVAKGNFWPLISLKCSCYLYMCVFWYDVFNDSLDFLFVARKISVIRQRSTRKIWRKDQWIYDTYISYYYRHLLS